MKIEYGIHFYINICNYSQIIEYEENSTGKLNHCIHLLNTFFTSVERYSAKYKKIEIEKITGSRLHLYAVGDIDEVVDDVLDVICYAYSFSLEVNRISKYKTLPSIKINAGASYGKFITHNIELSDNKTEFTSIGYACNYAAKLQNIAKSNYLCLDDEIYNEIKYKVQCEKLYNAKFKKKYNQDYYYSLAIDKLNNNEYGDFIDIQIVWEIWNSQILIVGLVLII